MFRTLAQCWWVRQCSLPCSLCLIWVICVEGSLPAAAAADVPAPADATALPEVWTLEDAIIWALLHNPELAAIREQHGIAAAAVVIAQTYPFNPAWEAKIRGVSGPESAGITNRVSNEHLILMEVELRHQGRFRRAGAAAALSRTDYEIAFQELGLAARVIRAFDTIIYRQEKVAVVEQTIKLNDETAKQVATLVEKGQLRSGDLILARTEVDDARAQRGSARAALIAAQSDWRRLLGLVTGAVKLQGSLEARLPPLAADELTATALERRPDLRARRAAVDEAEARLKLAQADRHGNPVIGPAFEYDPTRVNLIGTQFTLPLPVFNRRRGEIMQRGAEQGRALAELRQTEIQIRQDVAAAVQRLQEAQAWADGYQKQTLPNLRKALEEMNKLFLQNQPGTDVLRVIDIRRKLLKAQEGYLDALWEVSQGRADLAAALGDPQLALPAPPDPKLAAPPQ